MNKAHAAQSSGGQPNSEESISDSFGSSVQKDLRDPSAEDGVSIQVQPTPNGTGTTDGTESGTPEVPTFRPLTGQERCLVTAMNNTLLGMRNAALKAIRKRRLIRLEPRATDNPWIYRLRVGPMDLRLDDDFQDSILGLSTLTVMQETEQIVCDMLITSSHYGDKDTNLFESILNTENSQNEWDHQDGKRWLYVYSTSPRSRSQYSYVKRPFWLHGHWVHAVHKFHQTGEMPSFVGDSAKGIPQDYLIHQVTDRNPRPHFGPEPEEWESDLVAFDARFDSPKYTQVLRVQRTHGYNDSTNFIGQVGHRRGDTQPIKPFVVGAMNAGVVSFKRIVKKLGGVPLQIALRHLESQESVNGSDLVSVAVFRTLAKKARVNPGSELTKTMFFSNEGGPVTFLDYGTEEVIFRADAEAMHQNESGLRLGRMRVAVEESKASWQRAVPVILHPLAEEMAFTQGMRDFMALAGSKSIRFSPSIWKRTATSWREALVHWNARFNTLSDKRRTMLAELKAEYYRNLSSKEAYGRIQKTVHYLQMSQELHEINNQLEAHCNAVPKAELYGFTRENPEEAAGTKIVFGKGVKFWGDI